MQDVLTQCDHSSNRLERHLRHLSIVDLHVIDFVCIKLRNDIFIVHVDTNSQLNWFSYGSPSTQLILLFVRIEKERIWRIENTIGMQNLNYLYFMVNVVSCAITK